MIETIILEHLSRSLSVPAYTEKPPDAPASFVLMEKTAGGKTERLQTATIAVQSFGSTMAAAAALNEAVKAAMDAAGELDALCASRLNSDYNFTDTAAKGYRYQAVYDITYY